MKRSFAAVLGGMSLVSAVALAQPPARAMVQDPVFFAPSPGIETLTLENGLQVVLMPNPAQPMVGAYVVVKVGSAEEDFATSGMSHMLEHLLFNGTDEYTQEELYAAADRAGAYNNAHTADFYTDFMMVLPAGALETGLKLQSQMLFHSTLPVDKFAKEQGIVLGELVADRDDPSRQADTALRQALYQGSSLEMPTLGTRATIASLQRDDVYAFYKRWYVPNNMVLTLAGNFDRDGALALLRKYYGEVAPEPLPGADLVPLPPLSHSTSVVRRAGRDQTLALAFAAPEYGSEDYAAFLVAMSMLGADADGIIARALAGLDPQDRPEVQTWWQPAPGFGRAVVELTLTDGFGADDGYRMVQNAVVAQLETGLTADDIAQVVHMRETETLQEREQLRMTGISIADDIALGGVDHFATLLPRLRAVTPEQVARVLGSTFVDQPCQAVLLLPDPHAPAASPHGMPGGMPPGMGGMGKPAAAAPETTATYHAASAGAPAVPVDRSVMANGAVLVSQTVPGSELVAIHLTVRGRAQLDAQYAVPGALNLVHRMLTSGVSGCDESCLARRLRDLGAVIKLVDDPRFPMDDYYTTGAFSFIRVETTADNGLKVLDLLGELTQHSTFTRDDMERERQAEITILENRAGSASRQANTMLQQALYGDNPLALPPEGTPSDLQRVTYDQLRNLYRKAFAPQNLIWAVVSPLSHAELKAHLEAMAPGRGEPAPGLPPLPVTTAPARLTATIGGEMGAVRLGSVRTFATADAHALELLVAILSDRIQMDLREKRGLSYSTGAAVAETGDQAVFRAWINPPVERLEEGESALTQALRDFDAGSITQDELDRVRSAISGRQMMRRLSSISRAYYLAMAELDGDMDEYTDAISGYDRVTLADLQRVAGSFLGELPLVTVVVN